MSDLVGNPEDRFSRVAAQIVKIFQLLEERLKGSVYGSGNFSLGSCCGT